MTSYDLTPELKHKPIGYNKAKNSSEINMLVVFDGEHQQVHVVENDVQHEVMSSFYHGKASGLLFNNCANQKHDGKQCPKVLIDSQPTTAIVLFTLAHYIHHCCSMKTLITKYSS